MRVLVVDDDPEILDGLASFLKDEGYAVETARNGAEALEKTQTTKPDVLLVDLMMPVMDGAELIQRLRRETATSKTPVVVFSADRQVYQKASSLDVSGAIRKPLDFEELQQLLGRILAQATHDRRVVQ